MALLKPDGSGNINNYMGVGIYSPQGDISNSPGSQNTAFANSLVNSPVTGWDYYNGSSGVGKAGYGSGGNFLEFDLPFNFTPGNVTPRVFGFDLYIAVGTIQQIRAAFYQIAGHTYNPSVDKLRLTPLLSDQTGVRIGKLPPCATGVRIR
jgi:hypothetical protein